MEVRLLGALHVLTADGRTVAVTRRKHRQLLALLCLTPGLGVSVDRLVRGLWNGREPRSARGNVKTYVCDLRVLLGPEVRIEAVPHGYRVGGADVDAVRFAALADAGRRALEAGRYEEAARELAAALALWTGPALDGLGDGADLLGLAADQLAGRRLSAVHDHVEALLALRRLDEAVAHLRAALADDPLRERLWAQLMLALYRDGRRAEALDAYREAWAVITESQGLDPGRDLATLHARILSDDPSLG
ncbi:winged helix-turn-helix domain-containing protein [Nonomuraea sp. SMC257]|uniref:Winged helix-turn-helix domain-containing protein n=1 Tax=Nonomuraea montanisoli TaxID=2741721 RepID=A0A7Y6IA14_9ACTN|nr:BTAD domain-containing putative transcriptional regulator [Nonomuraea montanisoli]NUW34271.1 winged helix-turn-helix domain-containing protein [Nonomuraea montanisoli]